MEECRCEVKSLKVHYDDGGRIDPELDKKIRSFFRAIGFKWYGSGMDMRTGIRDHAFDGPGRRSDADIEA